MNTVEDTAVFAVRAADWTRRIPESPLQRALMLADRPGILSFALGLPAPELFPVQEFSRAADEVLAGDRRALQYGSQSAELKEHIVCLMRNRGVVCRPERIFLTFGAQQAVRFAVALLVDERRVILSEELCYSGFHQIARFHNPEILTVPTDLDTGMDVDKVEWYLKSGVRPALIYAIPDGHNPLGVTMSVEKRERLRTLARQYSVPILEEDPYGFLSYSGAAPAPILADCSDYVFYAGSFSKLLAPSLRIGWLIAPERFLPYLGILKEASDLNTASFSQHIVARLLRCGFLSCHLDRLRGEYRRRRDTMLAGLNRCCPAGAQIVPPGCGIYIWVKLPNSFDTVGMLEAAVNDYQLSFLPGLAFDIKNTGLGRNCLRLNFSNPRLSSISKGIDRLGAVIEEFEES